MKDTFKTGPLKTELAFEDEARTGGMAMVFRPVKASFADIKFEAEAGGKCTIRELEVNGSIAGKIEVGTTLVQVGSEPAATKVVKVLFPSSAPVKTVWLEEKGSLVASGIKLEGLGPVTTRGTLELEAGGAEWGVFS